ncbi:Rne/Rng family ribonuclease [Ponticaulis koreensis]|uniref:Rne/Rng family ribonuclease n=1 Tax=Ponticaulis koreensis TaxID=1123045 RepID=UPI0003B52A97|nr:ribonuclease E/G [Ponticaulis koreensis]
MTKMMLIDAVHPEEVRVAVVNKGQVEDFDFESAKKRQLRGNIYLAKITRVEPSLQAAFVDFGGNRHGFLAFSEIHPDYYQLPQADREALIAETASAVQADGDDADDIDEDDDERPSSKALLSKNYKIQEVIRRRQIMLVQAVKEERGNKGAALTTYLSLAGRYCVLMPNTPRGGGISRKITNSTDRKRLKEIVRDLNVPEGMGLIVRTAGAKRTKTEIKRDFEYLIKLWSKIRELTLSSVAPCLINEEAGLVHRALRDMYDKDIDQVLVDGEVAYREAKDLSKMLMPSHAKKVQQHKSGLPVFSEYGVESQLDNIFSPTVQLKSGGYLVIHQTEALVAIDVNSGKSTRERNIEQTALRTNLEAAEEACRQMRLRDLAGLVVIDFIDMEEAKNNRAVERRMKDCLKYDRARVQNNKISMFGLMEISRQRRRAGVLDTSSDPCTACNGTGHVRSIESSALQLLRAIESRSAGVAGGQIEVSAPTDVVLFLLNEKRQAISDLELRQKLTVQVKAQSDLLFGEFEIRVTNAEGDNVEPPKPKPIERVPITDDDDLEDIEDDEEDEEIAEEKPMGRKRRRRGRRKDQDRSSSDNLKVVDADADDEDDNSNGPSDFGSSDDDDGTDANSRKRRRRGRRGGRRRRGRDGAPEAVELNDENTTEDGGAVLDEAASNVVALVGEGVEIKATPEAKPEPEATADDVAETSEAAAVSEEAEAATPVETSEPETAPEQGTEAPEAVAEAPAETAGEPAKEETPPAELTEETASAEPAAPAAEAEEPKELPETEKPKKIRRGWWQRRSAG